MNRRKFIESLAAVGVGTALFPSLVSAAPSGGKKKKKGPVTLDRNLVCIITDTHVRPGRYQQEYFEKTIDGILALNPRPLNVLCLGDIAYLTGKKEEYLAAKQGLDRLEQAGITVTMTMGNHDRRANFAEVFPEKAAKSELSHRMVYTVTTPNADFILMDSLQEGEDHEKWINQGDIDPEQRAWLEAKLETYTSKPVFVMAHHAIHETKLGKLLMKYPCCKGYIYGHEHIWKSGWAHLNFRDRPMLRTLCLPSTGHWGDIGFTLLQLDGNNACASFVQDTFFFPKPLKEGEAKPAIWAEIERDHSSAICNFPF